MFGLNDIWISSAFILSILSAIACLVYGIVNWNKGDETDEMAEWQEHEAELEEKL